MAKKRLQHHLTIPLDFSRAARFALGDRRRKEKAQEFRTNSDKCDEGEGIRPDQVPAIGAGCPDPRATLLIPVVYSEKCKK
jgi:hypothetical protein